MIFLGKQPNPRFHELVTFHNLDNAGCALSLELQSTIYIYIYICLYKVVLVYVLKIICPCLFELHLLGVPQFCKFL